MGKTAGVEYVLLRRWRNLLGRTMWDFPGGRDGGNGSSSQSCSIREFRGHGR
jgi:hypothetical protein